MTLSQVDGRFRHEDGTVYELDELEELGRRYQLLIISWDNRIDIPGAKKINLQWEETDAIAEWTG